MNSKPILLVDGDILLYRCGFAAEHTYYLVEWSLGQPTYVPFSSYKEAQEHIKHEAETTGGEPPALWTRKEVQPVEFALNNVNTVLESFVSKFEPSDVRVYLSDDTCFRDKIAVTKPYKGNRDAAAKPKHYKAIKEFLLSRGAIVMPNLEADDALGIEQSKYTDGRSVLVTTDKDLDQISGRHYNWVTGESYEVSKRDADFTLFRQLLTGDSTDNIPGLPKMGPVGAEKILDGSANRKELYSRVRDRYADPGYFAEQAQLVFILRDKESGWKEFEESILSGT